MTDVFLLLSEEDREKEKKRKEIEVKDSLSSGFVLDVFILPS
jgi:hypothetical protein